MTLGTLLQIIIALIFIYLISSLVVSELQEQVASLLEFRAKNLRQAIEIFIGKPMMELLYDKSLLSSFNQYTNPKIRKSAGSSYIEPKVFAESLINEVNNLMNKDTKLSKKDLLFDNTGGQESGVISKIKTIENQYPDAVKRLEEIAYTTKLNHDNPTLENFRDEIANTFTQIMERTSGVYKRNAKGVSLMFGFLAAALLNIDSFHIISQLYKNPALTQEINQVATTAFEKHESCLNEAKDEQAKKKCAEIAMNESKKLEGLNQPLPIGWNDNGWFNSEQIQAQKGLLQAIIGWFITAIAIAMGAPFWFDLLGKFMNVRNTVKSISSEIKPVKK